MLERKTWAKLEETLSIKVSRMLYRGEKIWYSRCLVFRAFPGSYSLKIRRETMARDRVSSRRV